MEKELENWLLKVDELLRSIGYKHKRLSEKDWFPLFEEGLIPFKAVAEMEFGGKIKWKQIRELQEKLDLGTN